MNFNLKGVEKMSRGYFEKYGGRFVPEA